VDLTGPLRAPFVFALSLAIGLLIGLERERRPEAKAGVRTFSLIALTGTLSAMLASSSQSPWIVPAALLVIGASLVVAYALDPRASPDAGTTTVVAAVFCFGLGAALWYGHHALALGLSIVGTALLHFKTQLEGFSRKLTPRDVVGTLQFATLWVIVLPLLPNHGVGPKEVINPAHIWLMVVLVSGVSWASYVVWRLLGDRRGLIILGILGGLVSSTATTVVQARAGQRDGTSNAGNIFVTAVASLVLSGRIAVMTAIVAPVALPALGMVLGGALVGGLPFAYRWWRAADRSGSAAVAEFENPANLRTALVFGGAYSLVLLAAAWLADYAGASGLYPLAFVSGLTDVDAITLSSLRLRGAGSIDTLAVATIVGIAMLSNLIVKSGITFALGGRSMGWPVLRVFAGSGTGILVGLALLRW